MQHFNTNPFWSILPSSLPATSMSFQTSIPYPLTERKQKDKQLKGPLKIFENHEQLISTTIQLAYKRKPYLSASEEGQCFFKNFRMISNQLGFWDSQLWLQTSARESNLCFLVICTCRDDGSKLERIKRKGLRNIEGAWLNGAISSLICTVSMGEKYNSYLNLLKEMARKRCFTNWPKRTTNSKSNNCGDISLKFNHMMSPSTDEAPSRTNG